MQRPQGLAGCAVGIQRAGAFGGAVAVLPDEGVMDRLQPVDLVERGLEQLGGGDVAIPDQIGSLAKRETAKLGRRHGAPQRLLLSSIA